MQITIQKLPTTLQEFESLEIMDLKKPEYVCALFLCTLSLYEKDKDAGIKAMNILRGPSPMTEYDSQFLRDRLRGKSYLPLAYFEGATPENSYKPNVPYVLNVIEDSRPQDLEKGYIRFFLKTTGADSSRPIRLRQKASTGEWFLNEYSSILTGIRLPKAEDPWA